MENMQNISILMEGLRENNLCVIQTTLRKLVKDDEDILVIFIREAVASRRISPNSDTATIISSVILGANPRRSLLIKSAKKLGSSSSGACTEYLRWMDNMLSSNLHLEIVDWARQWSRLDKVRQVRRLVRSTANT